MDGLNAFLKYIQFEKRYSSYTVRSYETDILQFQAFCKDKTNTVDLRQADEKIIRLWIVSLMDAGLSPRSVNRKISGLASFYKFLVAEGMISRTPLDKVVRPRTRKRLPGFVDAESMDELLDNFEFGDDYEGLRNRMIIEMLYQTGMRLSELIQLKVKDIQLEQKWIRVTGKRNKERIIPVSDPFIKTFNTYMEARGKMGSATNEDRVFITGKGSPIYPKLVYRVVHKYLGFVSTLEKRSPHVLRHTFASQMLNRGGDINAIKELLGHANLGATQIYTHNTFEKLKQVYNQAHPRA